MKVKAMVLEKFKEPFVLREFAPVPLGEGEILVKIQAAGVCGSDVHIWEGNDPRVPLPVILGHEGIGIIEDIGQNKSQDKSHQEKDILGRSLNAGDLVIWDRGLTCGNCYFCTIKNKPYLCPERRVYGISFTSSRSPHLLGCYSEYIHLLSGTKLMKIEEDIDPSVLVTAACSGATAAHALELSCLKEGDTVVIQGPGPLGIFAVAMAREQGAADIVVIGSSASRDRLKICKEFGATAILVRDETCPEERLAYIRDLTNGRGAEVVIECSGSPQALKEGIRLVAPGGRYLIPGIATPTGEVPLDIYEDVSRKNVAIQGIWVNDTRHLYQAVKLILSRKYPFEKMITHTFNLEEVTAALEAVKTRRALKAVIVPS